MLEIIPKVQIELKPCPFCGGKANYSFLDHSYGGQNCLGDKKIKYRVQVICGKCHSRGKPILTDWLINPNPWSMNADAPEGWKQREQAESFAPYMEKAAQAWNNRT